MVDLKHYDGFMLLWIWGAGALLAGIYFSWLLCLKVYRLELLEKQAQKKRSDFPLVSVIIPSHNQADRLINAVSSIMESGYPDFEVVIVDDRSHPMPQNVLEYCRQQSPRVILIRNETVPPGWMAKTYALHTGYCASHGDYVIFTDADINFGKKVINQAAGMCLENRLDHLSMVPVVVRKTLPQHVLCSFLVIGTIMKFLPLFSKGNPAFGVGAFNMIRRTSFDRAGGFERIRFDPLDDLALGRLFRTERMNQKQYGTRDLLRFNWYASLGDVLRGIKKNHFAVVARYRYTLAAMIGVFTIAISLGTIIGLVNSPNLVLLAVWLLSMAGAGVMLRRKMAMPFHYLFFYPVAGVILGLNLFVSAWTFFKEGGITWGGVFYSASDIMDDSNRAKGASR